MTILNGAAMVDVDREVVEWFEGVAGDAGRVQTRILKEIVERNCGTEYLTKWMGPDVVVDDLDAEALEALYTSSVPLVSHADLDPYIQRIAGGDDSAVLTGEPITQLSLSSGTTDGRQKLVPFTRFSSQSTLQIFRLAAAYRSRVFPTRGGGRVLEFIYSSKQVETEGGLRVGTATTHYFASEEFKTRQKSTRCAGCSPYEVISWGGDYQQTTYCHLLLGLALRDHVEVVTSTFAYSLVQALAALEQAWPELCEDVRRGRVSAERVGAAELRRSVMGTGHLDAPNPALAEEIERLCEDLRRRDWSGVVPALWPNAKYVLSIMTGSMRPYLKKLRHYGGELPLVCADYGSTESWIGVNLGPADPADAVTFTLVPTFSYFEFIPLSKPAKPSPLQDDFVEGELLPLSKVKLGEQYEVVLTTFTGLYRYRLGDVVEVAGFYKGTPQLNFICRRKLILTLNIDKNTEKDLQLVVEKAAGLLAHRTRAELVDFTSHADATQDPGHYVIYWEIRGGSNGSEHEQVLQECCRVMDTAFVDQGYVVSRKTNSIGPLELRVVEGGTFRRILDYYISKGAAMSQFKTPRCTSNQALLTILNSCTTKIYRSTAYE